MFARPQQRPPSPDRRAQLPGAGSPNPHPHVDPIDSEAPLRPITIAYRECSRGAGAFWDHYTIQKSTGRPTIASHSENVKRAINYEARRKNYRGPLPNMPGFDTGVGRGLLVLTGGNYGLDDEYPRNMAHVPKNDAAWTRHRNRQMHERELLKQAYRTGRPVLGICGGSWTVLESYGGTTFNLDPRTHQTRTGPSILKNGNISNNFAEHDIEIFDDKDHPTLLANVNKGPFRELRNHRTVDSNHWAAAREVNAMTGQSHALFQRPPRPDEVDPDEADGMLAMLAATEMLEAKLRLLVVAARDAGVDQRRQRRLPARAPMHTIEAFETRHGAPVVGVQWHPERYAVGQDHKEAAAMSKALLMEMAQAGDAYEARRAMMLDFPYTLERGKRIVRAGLTSLPHDMDMQDNALPSFIKAAQGRYERSEAAELAEWFRND